MFKKDSLIEEIMQYFSTLQAYVYIANKQGLFNINKFSEDFFCGLLNIIESLNLLNLNKLKMNFPGIDLGDNEKRICYQVTSENELTKIKQTVSSYVDNELFNDYDLLKILILGRKAKYKKKLLEYGAFKFSVDENVIDLGDLITKIGTLSTDIIEEVLNYLKTNFDKSILSKINELAIDKNLLIEEHVNEAYPFSYYVYGLGKVRVDAYLPLKTSDTISCLLTFGQDNISGCNITLDEETLKKSFFSDYYRKLDERNFVVYKEKNQACVEFPNNRFITDTDTADQIANISDKLFERYKEKKAKIIELIGADNFLVTDKDKYKIIKIPKVIWDMMYGFSLKHDCFTGEGEWDIFNPQSIDDRIIIYKNHKEKSFNADILVNLMAKRIGKDYVEVIWSPGYTHSLNEIEGFNNKQKWKVDYTHDWLINRFIPYVLYLEYLGKRKFFSKLITFEQYKRKFELQDFGIESLKIE